jgi:hypothetical protein
MYEGALTVKMHSLPRAAAPFQKPATLIVEKVFVPFVLHQFRYDHDNAARG